MTEFRKLGHARNEVESQQAVARWLPHAKRHLLGLRENVLQLLHRVAVPFPARMGEDGLQVMENPPDPVGMPRFVEVDCQRINRLAGRQGHPRVHFMAGHDAAAVERIDQQPTRETVVRGGGRRWQFACRHRYRCQKVPRRIDAADSQADPFGNQLVDQHECGGNPLLRFEDPIEVTVCRIVEVGFISSEAGDFEQHIVQMSESGGVRFRRRPVADRLGQPLDGRLDILDGCIRIFMNRYREGSSHQACRRLELGDGSRERVVGTRMAVNRRVRHATNLSFRQAFGHSQKPRLFGKPQRKPEPMPAPDQQPALRTIAMPADTNPHGDIFGGWLLSQMDLAGGNIATRRAVGRVATVAIDAMTFHAPVEVGDEVSCYATVQRVGRTSLTVLVNAYKRKPADADSDQVLVTEGTFTYVHLDERRRPEAIT